MHRIDRLLGYILLLQGRRPRTAGSLAEHFEVSRRTVYLDLDALGQIGVPIVATSGRGYELAPGYYLPPVMLTTDEAAALSLGGGLFHHFVAHEGRIALDNALRKVEAVLPEQTRDEVQQTRRHVCLTSWPHRAAPLDSLVPTQIRRAMRERRRIRCTYHSRSTGASGDRDIDPYYLVYLAGDWQLVGFCHRRRRVRQFRLSRMEDLRLLDERFEIPAEADAQAFWANQIPRPYGDRIARVRFADWVIRWAREQRHYTWEAEEDTSDGAVVTVRMERWDEVLPWLLGWGGSVEVLDPPELRRLVASEARRILANYAEL
jgi:predicted DNA-binding transcriptional regulator YafY